MNSKLLSNIPKYYIYNFFALFILFDGTLSLYFQHKLGLSFSQVTIVYGVFTLLVGILEIPTGVLADKLGYKKTLALATLCMILASIGYKFSTSIVHLIFVEAVWALGFSLNSGTQDSFMYSTLKEAGKEDRFNSVMGIGNALMFSGLAVSAVIGGLMAKYDLALPIKFGYLPLIIPFITVLTFKEPPIDRSELNHFQHVKESFKFILYQPKLKFIIFYVVVLAVAFETVYKFTQPYMYQLGIPISLIGISFSCSYIISAVGSLVSHGLSKLIGEKVLFYLLYAALFITLLMLKINTVCAILGLMILLPIFEGIHGPVTSGFINRHTKDKVRATVNSIANLSKCLIAAIALPIFGILAERSINIVFFVNAGAVLGALFIVISWYKRVHRDPDVGNFAN